MLEESMPVSVVQDDEGQKLINFRKFESVSNLLRKFNNAQRLSRSIKKLPHLYRLLKTLPALDAEVLEL